MTIERTYIEDDVYIKFYLAEGKKNIEKLLEEYGKKSYKDKYNFLYNIMGIGETFNCDNSKNQEEQEKKEYEACLAIFLEGTWRVL